MDRDDVTLRPVRIATAVEHPATDLEPEAAIALELRLGEELVARRLMRKVRVILGVLHDVGRHLRDARRLDVDQRADLSAPVIDLADRAGIGADATFVTLADAGDIHANVHAEIDPALADRVAEVLEREVTIRTTVAGDDVTASATHELINTQVFKMSAIGQIHELRACMRGAKALAQKVTDCEQWA